MSINRQLDRSELGTGFHGFGMNWQKRLGFHYQNKISHFQQVTRVDETSKQPIASRALRARTYIFMKERRIEPRL